MNARGVPPAPYNCPGPWPGKGGEGEGGLTLVLGGGRPGIGGGMGTLSCLGGGGRRGTLSWLGEGRGERKGGEGVIPCPGCERKGGKD